MSTAAPIALVIVHFPDGWRILARNERWGRFAYRVDAEEAALRLAGKLAAQGETVEIWVQTAVGRLEELSLPGRAA